MATLGMNASAIPDGGPPEEDAVDVPAKPRKKVAKEPKLDVSKTVSGLRGLADRLGKTKFKRDYRDRRRTAEKPDKRAKTKATEKKKREVLSDSSEDEAPNLKSRTETPDSEKEQTAVAPRRRKWTEEELLAARRKDLTTLLNVYQGWAAEVAPRMSWNKFVLSAHGLSGNREIKLELSDMRWEALGGDCAPKRRAKTSSPAQDAPAEDPDEVDGLGLVTGAPPSDPGTPTDHGLTEKGALVGVVAEQSAMTVAERLEKNRQEALRLKAVREARRREQEERDMEEARQAELGQDDRDDLEDELMRDMN